MSPAFLRLWGIPIVLAVLTAIGLLAALLGDGVLDYISAVALAIPVGLGAWHGWCPQRQ